MTRPGFLAALLCAVMLWACSGAASAAYHGYGNGAAFTVAVGEAGAWFNCGVAGLDRPDSDNCTHDGSVFEGDAVECAAGSCWTWPFADGFPPGLLPFGEVPPDPDPGPEPCGSVICPADAITLSWGVVGCWAGLFGIRMLARSLF